MIFLMKKKRNSEALAEIKQEIEAFMILFDNSETVLFFSVV